MTRSQGIGHILAGQSGEQAKTQRQGAEAPKDRQDSVHSFALPAASGDDQPSEPPTDIQPGILAVLFASSRLGVAPLVIHPIALHILAGWHGSRAG
jgi:hypothetical protein